MNKIAKGFFAYPNDIRISETIGSFTQKINQTSLVNIKTWEQMKIGGKILVAEICKEIDTCDFFCADITKLNPNVLFEIGYAIARKKRIWLIKDSSFTSDHADFVNFKILTNLGYREYINSNDINTAYYNDLPHESLGDTIFDQIIEPSIAFTSNNKLLYLKSYYEDDTSIKVSQMLDNNTTKSTISLIVDDPKESSIQPISWYASNANSSRGVICHLTHYDRIDSRIHNAKHSLVAGMAHGFEVPVLLLIDSDPLGPTDYRDILVSYKKPKEVLTKLENFLLPVLDESKAIKKTEINERIKNREIEQLASLKIGEPIAEHEDDNLTDDGFIETTAFRAGLEGAQSIFVGRKGVGKTANFKKLSSVYRKDKRNVVCEIKPLSYELESLVDVAKQFESTAKKGFLFETLWKYLIYTEIAKVINTAICERPSGETFENEKDLLEIIRSHKIAVELDFSARLDHLSRTLLDRHNSDSSDKENQIAVSEVLHANIIPNLVSAICKSLLNKVQIVVLIDNLDKAWDRSNNSRFLSYFFLGLLSALRRISNDFKNRVEQKEAIKMSVCVFVRADIFQMVLEQAREPDKIQFFPLRWDDPSHLMSLADARIKVATNLQGSDIPAKLIWEKFFKIEVFGLPLFDHIFSVILPRPRDLLYFLRASIMAAVNRRHVKVLEEDLEKAEEDYSNFAYQSMLVELRERFPFIDKILDEFLGFESIVDITVLENVIKKYITEGISTDDTIKHLCLCSFLEIDVPKRGFNLVNDEHEFVRFYKAASNIEQRTGKKLAFRIHRAFRNALLLDTA
jgi:hypothetical protein